MTVTTLQKRANKCFIESGEADFLLISCFISSPMSIVLEILVFLVLLELLFHYFKKLVCRVGKSKNVLEIFLTAVIILLNTILQNSAPKFAMKNEYLFFLYF